MLSASLNKNVLPSFQSIMNTHVCGCFQHKPTTQTDSIKLVHTCSDCCVLQDHPVVDEADVFGRCRGAGSLPTQQVKDPRGQHSVFTILNELTQVSKA